jgi:hypothetical protein
VRAGDKNRARTADLTTHAISVDRLASGSRNRTETRPDVRGNVDADRKLTVALLADGLFRDAVSVSENDSEGRYHALIKVLYWYLLVETEEYHERS